MHYSSKRIMVLGSLGVLLACAACAPKRIPSMTVQDLMDDRVTLDGVLMKCNQSPTKASNDSDCLNARIAIERLAQDVDPAVVARRNAEFEHSRDQLRLAQDKVRRDQEARSRVDAYDLPVMPVDSPAPGSAPATAQPKP
jgi:hypothetical protein